MSPRWRFYAQGGWGEGPGHLQNVATREPSSLHTARSNIWTWTRRLLLCYPHIKIFTAKRPRAVKWQIWTTKSSTTNNSEIRSEATSESHCTLQEIGGEYACVERLRPPPQGSPHTTCWSRVFRNENLNYTRRSKIKHEKCTRIIYQFKTEESTERSHTLRIYGFTCSPFPRFCSSFRDKLIMKPMLPILGRLSVILINIENN